MRMIRAEIINLYELIKGLKSNKLTPEAKKDYTLLRIELVKLYKEFEQAREEIIEQTKPDSENEQEWNEAFQPIILEWLNAESNIDSRVFTVEDYIDFISSNELVGEVEDYIGLQMIKE